MEFSTALAAQLATLGRAAAELPDTVDELHRLLLALVPSAVGLSTTVLISDVDLTLCLLTPDPAGLRERILARGCGPDAADEAARCSRRSSIHFTGRPSLRLASAISTM